MKKVILHSSLFLLLTAALPVVGCKNKNKDTTSTNVDTTTYTAPVTVAGDDELRRGVTDATKDHPGVNATVNNGEITLTGEIKREDLQRLMPALNALNPKKINNNLTVK